MSDNESFLMTWDKHQTTLLGAFGAFLENGAFSDCILGAEGKFIKAHKMVLSACSPYFEVLLSQQCDKYPIIMLKDIKFGDLEALMQYMYNGKMTVNHEQFRELVQAAKFLQIRDLSQSIEPMTAKDENSEQRPEVDNNRMDIGNIEQDQCSSSNINEASPMQSSSEGQSGSEQRQLESIRLDIGNIEQGQCTTETSSMESLSESQSGNREIENPNVIVPESVKKQQRTTKKKKNASPRLQASQVQVPSSSNVDIPLDSHSSRPESTNNRLKRRHTTFSSQRKISASGRDRHSVPNVGE